MSIWALMEILQIALCVGQFFTQFQECSQTKMLGSLDFEVYINFGRIFRYFGLLQQEWIHLEQRFPTCGLRSKSGLLSLLKWPLKVALALSKN